MPDPLLPVAIVAHSKADEDKLSQGLSRLVAEDPTLRLEQNPDTHQLVLWCLGEAHVDVAARPAAQPLRREGRLGADARVAARDVRGPAGARPARQAVRRARAVRGLRHRGGAAAGGARASSSSTRSSAARCRDSSSRPSRRACAPSCEQGVAAGYPVVDIQVTLVDGKAHSVDSSDMAFQTAGALALREAAAVDDGHVAGAGRRVLTVVVSDEYVGSVMSDLSGRRGRVLGTEPAASGRTLDPGRGPGDRDDAVRHRPALALARHGDVRPALRPARADAAAAGEQGDLRALEASRRYRTVPRAPDLTPLACVGLLDRSNARAHGPCPRPPRVLAAISSGCRRRSGKPSPCATTCVRDVEQPDTGGERPRPPRAPSWPGRRGSRQGCG